MSEYGECEKCGIELVLAPGIDIYCPNKECTRTKEEIAEAIRIAREQPCVFSCGCCQTVDRLSAQNKAYRVALEFYANEENWECGPDDTFGQCELDGGVIAQQALTTKGEEDG